MFMSLKPYSVRTLNRTPSLPPVSPRLVRIVITPFAARVPYSDAPAAPFTTSIDSMSMPPSSVSTPTFMMMSSMMISGPWPRPEALIDVGPRSRISGVEPGYPVVWAIRTPATLPCRARIGSTAATGISSAVTRPTANGTLERSTPSITPVTITSSSLLMSWTRLKSMVRSPAASATEVDRAR